MDELKTLRSLAKAIGVHTRFTDGLGKRVIVGAETLVRVCTAAGAPLARISDAADALREHRARARSRIVPAVIVAWDGNLPPLTMPTTGSMRAEVQLAESGCIGLDRAGTELRAARPLPFGYHRLTAEVRGRLETCTVIAAPMAAWHRPGPLHGWGVGAQLAALRSGRSRSVGDLRDLRSLCEWIRQRGGDVVTLLPLLPTFNSIPPEPSPYSPVSRLFWSELILDLGDAHRSTPRPATLDVSRADAEVHAALSDHPAPPESLLDAELLRYARFRGAQARHGRNWRAWPASARDGTLTAEHVDSRVERFHLVAQTLARSQLHDMRLQLERDGFRLGLDLAVGVHPDGYDPWSRPALFGDGMSVGAPPDAGFPSGQDWGFAPVLPEASRTEGHRYLAAAMAHHASLAGLLRVDHVMALTRLYWIPHGAGIHEGTYVSYPADELFAVLNLESHRNQCEVVGENLGTVPPEIDEALSRHRIWGMYLAQFEASKRGQPREPTGADVALIGTHDTPTLAGWIAGNDITERVRYGLLSAAAAPAAEHERQLASRRLSRRLGRTKVTPDELLGELLEWLGRSASPLVIAWLEDLWLEDRGVNLPGTSSSQRANWQRPMSRLLDEVLTDPLVEARLARLAKARTDAPMPAATTRT